MLTATAEVIAFLNSTTAGEAVPLFTVTLRDGTVYRWAQSPSNVAVGSTTWLAHGRSGRPLISSFGYRVPIGLDEVGRCRVSLGCDASVLIGSTPMPLAAARGAFDGATLQLGFAVRAGPASSVVGAVFPFSGEVTAAPSDSHSVSLIAETAAAKFKRDELPKTTVSKSCTNALGDAACGVNLAPLRVSATVGGGSTRTSVVLTGTWTDGNWDLGVLAITSGALLGEKVGIRSSVGGTLTLTQPLSAAPVAGVTVTLTPGCDHTSGAKGCLRFSNIPKFRGMPHLPREY